MATEETGLVPAKDEKAILAEYAGYTNEEDTHDTQPLSSPMLRWQHMGASSLERIGGKFYNSLEGSDKPYDSIEVVFINGRNSRAFYEQPYDAKAVKANGAQPPDCKSNDGLIGEGTYGRGSAQNPSGRCEVCPMSQWSGRGKDGKPPRCSLSYDRLIYDFQTGQVGIISFSRTKIKAISDFQRALQARNGGTVPMWGYKCRITSEPRENWFVPKIEILGIMPPADALKFREMKIESDAAFMRQSGLTPAGEDNESGTEAATTEPADPASAAAAY